MWLLLLLLILIIFFWPVIKLAWRINQVRSQFNNINREAQRQAGQHRQQRQSAPRPRKVYTKDDGEYVDFEEVSVTAAEERSEVHYIPESQVSDAEWEEIK